MSTERKRAGRLAKCPTGIAGLDEVLRGGLPQARPTLLCGGPGCGKTVLAMEFLLRGAEDGEPGVYVSFEESEDELRDNFGSFDFDLAQHEAAGSLALQHVRIDRGELVETGEYSLDGLFARLGHAVRETGARRLVLDGIGVCFEALQNRAVLRREFKRLFDWIKDQGLTALVTAERGEDGLSPHGLEAYVSDCVIALDHRSQDEISTRRLQVVKYRGSGHGMNEYPFLIDAGGLSVFPITSLGLQHEAPLESIASGVPDLDRMLAGGGFYRGSSILVSGRAGTGKSSLAAAFVRAACDRNERCTYFAFEESPSQIMRNMRSIGIDLAPGVEQGLLRFAAQRPTACGLEEHLARVNAQLRDHRPAVVVVDPMTNLVTVGNPLQIRAMLNRLVDTLKQRRITALFTSLASGTEGAEQTSTDVSSLMDAWLALDVQECAGQRCRTLHVLKVRGRRHDTDRKWLQLGDDGVHLDDLDRCGAGPGDAAGGQPRPGGGPQS